MISQRDRNGEDMFQQRLDRILSGGTEWYRRLPHDFRKALLKSCCGLSDLVKQSGAYLPGKSDALQAARERGLNLGRIMVRANLPLTYVAEAIVLQRELLVQEPASLTQDIAKRQPVQINSIITPMIDEALLGLARAYDDAGAVDHGWSETSDSL